MFRIICHSDPTTTEITSTDTPISTESVRETASTESLSSPQTTSTSVQTDVVAFSTRLSTTTKTETSKETAPTTAGLTTSDKHQVETTSSAVIWPVMKSSSATEYTHAPSVYVSVSAGLSSNEITGETFTATSSPLPTYTTTIGRFTSTHGEKLSSSITFSASTNHPKDSTFSPESETSQLPSTASKHAPSTTVIDAGESLTQTTCKTTPLPTSQLTTTRTTDQPHTISHKNQTDNTIAPGPACWKQCEPPTSIFQSRERKKRQARATLEESLFEMRESITESISSLPLDVRLRMGYSLQDLVLDCQFAGISCNSG